MASADATVPTRTVGVPIRALVVEVASGPDAGTSVVARGDAVTVGAAEGNTIVLRDRTVSRFHLELQRRGDRVRVTDVGSTNGTHVGRVRLDGTSVTVEPGTRLRVGNTELEVRDGETTVVEQSEFPELRGIKGRSEPVQRLVESIVGLARHHASVLVVGESGTGKELVARALHDLGPRKDAPFVVVDCGAVAPSLFASQLFGHERGAFTGATSAHVGAVESAHGGTLFLDEIGELPQDQQAALLGVLERRTLRRVGGRTDVPVDVRVVSATHRDVRADVNAGTFRLDLYFRLAVVTLAVPPLRERVDDLPLLVEHFLREEGFTEPREALFPDAALRELALHRWPGNVRELRNVVSAAVATGRAASPDAAASPAPADGGDPIGGVLELDYKAARRTVTDAFEARYLARLLERADGSVRAAARIAGVDRGYLSELLKRHGIRRGNDT